MLNEIETLFNDCETVAECTQKRAELLTKINTYYQYRVKELKDTLDSYKEVHLITRDDIESKALELKKKGKSLIYRHNALGLGSVKTNNPNEIIVTFKDDCNYTTALPQ